MKQRFDTYIHYFLGALELGYQTEMFVLSLLNLITAAYLQNHISRKLVKIKRICHKGIFVVVSNIMKEEIYTQTFRCAYIGLWN